MVNPGYRKRTIFLLVALLLVRFWFGQTFELSGQEAYLWLQGHGTNLSPAYWERGPLVPLLIRIGTAFFGDTELGVRWPAAVICCTTGFILFYLARHWFNARAAFWTVVLFIVVPMYAWKLSFMTEATASVGLMALAMFAFNHAIEKDRPLVVDARRRVVRSRPARRASPTRGGSSGLVFYFVAAFRARASAFARRLARAGR